MAAVYPRTCYKCGEVGHVADDCQQEEDCVTIVTNQDMNQMIVLIQNKIPPNNVTHVVM